MVLAALCLGGQQAVQLLDGVADGHIGVVAIHIAQKAHLHNVGARTGQRLDNAAGCGNGPSASR